MWYTMRKQLAVLHKTNNKCCTYTKHLLLALYDREKALQHGGVKWTI